MYYDQGALPANDRKPLLYGNASYQMQPAAPAAGAAPSYSAPARGGMSYADYYSGRTGRAAPAKKKMSWEEELRRLYPRGLVGGRIGAHSLMPNQPMPYGSQPGQVRPGGAMSQLQYGAQPQWGRRKGVDAPESPLPSYPTFGQMSQQPMQLDAYTQYAPYGYALR
jgi:hypothetical protein